MTDVICILSPPELLGETIRVSQRIWKSRHEALNLTLIYLHEQLVHREPLRWETTYERFVDRADALIILGNMEEFNSLTSFCMQKNIPVYTSYEDWYNSLEN